MSNIECKSRPKVSIVIPIYNVEQYLRECLDSVINQTLKEIEIICVNDGSTDGCLDILQEYAQKDDRIIIIDKANFGYGHTMNRGFEKATGEYIGIVESDDYVDLHMYEDLYKIAVKNELDVVKADFHRFVYEENKIKLDLNKVARDAANYNRVYRPFDNPEVFRFIMNTWSGIYRTDYIRQYNIDHNETPGASYQDNGFWFKSFVHAERIMFVDKPYYMNRRDNPNSSVHNKNKVYCACDEYKYIKAYLEQFPELNERFNNMYYLKMYHTYMFTYNRIGEEFRREFLSVFSRNFAEAYNKNELNNIEFTQNEWEQILWIIRDPEEYFFETRKNKRVSVIIPIYNASEYLKETLSSLVNQTLQDIEIICVNDGSTDNSMDILLDFQTRDPRIRILNQQNQGAGAARNLGMSIATGEYISFLDADDIFKKDMLEKAYRKAIQSRADICVFGSNRFDQIANKTTRNDFTMRKNMLPNEEVFRCADIEGNVFQVFMGWAWDKLYRRRFIQTHELKFQQLRTTNDMFFVFAAFLKANKVCTLDEVLITQRRGVSGSLSVTRELSWDCFYKALMRVKSEMIEMGIYSTYEKDFIRYALHSCLWNVNTLEVSVAYELLERLRQEWFEKLEITDKEESYFDNKKEWEQYSNLLEMNKEEFTKYKFTLLHEEIERLNKEVTKVKNQKVATNKQPTQNVNHFIGYDEAFYINEIKAIKGTWTYRIGSAITFIPRKVRQRLRK